MKRVVITGPTGAIGIALIQYFIKNNIEVLAICREDSKRAKSIPSHPLVKIAECNLENLANLKVEDESYDVFYHFAWGGTFGNTRNDMYLQNNNVRYTLDAVQLAKKLGCHTFIGAGSQAEYGRVEGNLTAYTPAFPDNGYGIAKLCAGQMSRHYCQSLGMKHIWTRILSVYGPYDGNYTMVMSTILKLLANETPTFTKGEQKWDYLYSEDAAKAMFLLGEKGVDGKVYCIGSGKERQLSDYITVIRDSINEELALGLGEIPYNSNQVMYLCADISELTKDTGFIPSFSFEEGISKTIEWVKGTI